MTRQEVEERQFNRHAGTDREAEVPKPCKGAVVQLIARTKNCNSSSCLSNSGWGGAQTTQKYEVDLVSYSHTYFWP